MGLVTSKALVDSGKELAIKVESREVQSPVPLGRRITIHFLFLAFFLLK